MSQATVPVASTGASGGSFSGKMKIGSIHKIHPSVQPIQAGRGGFTLHMAQLSSLPCPNSLPAVDLILSKLILLHLAT